MKQSNRITEVVVILAFTLFLIAILTAVANPSYSSYFVAAIAGLLLCTSEVLAEKLDLGWNTPLVKDFRQSAIRKLKSLLDSGHNFFYRCGNWLRWLVIRLAQHRQGVFGKLRGICYGVLMAKSVVFGDPPLVITVYLFLAVSDVAGRH